MRTRNNPNGYINTARAITHGTSSFVNTSSAVHNNSSGRGLSSNNYNTTSDELGIPFDLLKHVLSTSATTISCIYEISLGYVGGALRNSLKLPTGGMPDNYIVIKYGYTNDLLRRMSEHRETYSSISGAELKLMTYCYVDRKYLPQAEKDIKSFFADISVPIRPASPHRPYNELVAINPSHIPRIKKQFGYINQEYSGNVKDLIDKNLMYQYELTNKSIQIDNKNEVINSKNEVIKTKDEMIALLEYKF